MEEKTKNYKSLLFIISALLLCSIILIILLLCGVFNQESDRSEGNNDKTSSSNTDDSDIFLDFIQDETEKGDVTEETTSAHNHIWSRWETVEASTCSKNGTQERKCECGEKETESIEMIDHTESSGWIIDVEAALGVEGKKHTECTVCGATVRTETIAAITYSEGLNFRLNDDGAGYTVIGFGECTDRTLAIPNTYKGLPVTTIGEGALRYQSYSYGRSLNSVIIPDSVTSIEASAFSGQNFTEIHWSSELKEIGDSAFSGCDNLTELTIPNKVITIGNNAFSNCESLKKVTISDSVTKIGEQAFANCKKLTSVNFGTGLTEVDYKAFDACSNITTVTVTDIQSWCKINFDVRYVRYYGSSTYELEYSANPLCYARHLYLSSGERVQSLNLTTDIEYVGSGTFSNCPGIDKITISSSVSNIYDYAFYGCSNLIEVSFTEDNASSTPTIIGEYAFANCTKLHNIKLDGVSSIEYCAFSDCTAISSIKLPDSITSLGGDGRYNYVFVNCTNLTTLEFGTGMPELDGTYFKDCDNLSTIIFPEGITKISGIFNGTNVTSITLPITLIELSTLSNVTEVSIPYGITTIGKEWFSYSGITNIIIPDSVTTIDDRAFSHCTNLTTLTLPKSIKHIGADVFDECKNLTNLYYSGTISQWKSIDKCDKIVWGTWYYWTGDRAGFSVIHCIDGDVSKYKYS